MLGIKSVASIHSNPYINPRITTLLRWGCASLTTPYLFDYGIFAEPVYSTETIVDGRLRLYSMININGQLGYGGWAAMWKIFPKDVNNRCTLSVDVDLLTAMSPGCGPKLILVNKDGKVINIEWVGVTLAGRPAVNLFVNEIAVVGADGLTQSWRFEIDWNNDLMNLYRDGVLVLQNFDITNVGQVRANISADANIPIVNNMLIFGLTISSPYDNVWRAVYFDNIKLSTLSEL